MDVLTPQSRAHSCWPAYVHHLVALTCAIVIAAGLEVVWLIVKSNAVHSGVLEQYDLGTGARWMCLSQFILAVCWQ